MIEIEIPNNVSEYKPKFILNLTGRQVTSVLLTAVAIFLDFTFLEPYVGETVAIIIAIIPALCGACFGWVEPYGMTFEKYLKSVLFQAVLAPHIRKAKTNSSIIVPCDKNYTPIPDSALSAEVLECVNYVREKLNDGTDKEESSSNKKHRKPKYKKSKQAYL